MSSRVASRVLNSSEKPLVCYSPSTIRADDEKSDITCFSSRSSRSSSHRKKKNDGVLAEFAVPDPPEPYPIRKIPNRVLAEDDYVSALDKIIERDFYPDLPRLRLTIDLLSAQKRKDTVAIRRAKKRLLDLTPATPAEGRQRGFSSQEETPKRLEELGTPGRSPSVHLSDALMAIQESGGGDDRGNKLTTLSDGRQVLVDTSVSLDKFQAMYTSEDNASFNHLLAEEKVRRRLKEAWIEAATRLHNVQLKEIQDEMAKADEEGMRKSESNLALLTHPMVARNALMFAPDATTFCASIEDDFEGPKKVKEVHGYNTRFPTALQDSEALMQQQLQKMQRLDAAINKDKKMTSLVEQGFPTTEGASDADGGYGLVSTPNLRPGVDLSPLMTWGEVDGTPLLLEGGSTGPRSHNTRFSPAVSTPGSVSGSGPCFSVPELPAKDQTAHALADSVSRKLRDRRRRQAQLLRSAFTPADKQSSIFARPASSHRTPSSRSSSSRRVSRSSRHSSSSSNSLQTLAAKAKRLHGDWGHDVDRQLRAAHANSGKKSRVAAGATPDVTTIEGESVRKSRVFSRSLMDAVQDKGSTD